MTETTTHGLRSHATTPWPDELDCEQGWTAAAAEQRGGAGYDDLLRAQRLLQDRLAGAVLPDDLVAAVTERLGGLADLLAGHQADEAHRWDGWRPDLPGRGSPLLPPYQLDEVGEKSLRGHVTFSRFYLGGNAAVHGGAHGLLFDDVMGQVVGRATGGLSRTAYLKVNYRSVTPLDVVLHFDCTLDGMDGRKRFASARLRNPVGDVVCDAEGLFLRLLPGQQ